MSKEPAVPARVGWVGVGRMGQAMCERLLVAGHNLTVWNRTPERAAPVVELGASVAEDPRDLLTNQAVFSMVLDDAALHDVYLGTTGLLSCDRPTDAVLVDCSTVSPAASAVVAEAALARGVAFLAAPVSGTPSVVRSGDLSLVVSGPADAYDAVAGLLTAIGPRVTYAGPGQEARVIKLCTNLLVAVTAQCLSEAAVLAEKSGVTRTALMDFINKGAVASPFTRYKTAAIVGLDFTPAFTAEGQRKDLRLALELAAEVGVSAPVTVETEHQFTRLIDSGLSDGRDFQSLLLLAASDAQVELEPQPLPGQ